MTYDEWQSEQMSVWESMTRTQQAFALDLVVRGDAREAFLRALKGKETPPSE